METCTSTNGAFKRILQTGVGPGSWIVIATVNGNVFTGESYDSEFLGDAQTLTITGGMAVPAGTAQLLSLQCGLYDGSNRTMIRDHEGVRIILLRIDHFFDVSQFPS